MREGSNRHPQQLGRAGLVPTRAAQRFDDEVHLVGVKRFTGPELLRHLYAGETGWLPYTPDYPFDEALVDVDRQRIVELYRSYGFYQARVLAMEIVVDEGDREVDLIIRVEEGKQAQVRALQVNWPPDTRVSAMEQVRVEGAGTLNVGGAFETVRLNDTLGNLRQALLKLGYPMARVSGRADVYEEARLTDVTIDVAPGPPAIIGEVQIEGLLEVPSYMCDREVKFGRGERYSPAVVAQMEDALKGMRVFRWVSARPPEKVEEGRVDLTMRVNEADPQTIRVGAELTVETVRWQEQVTIDYTHTNLFGHLTRLDLHTVGGWAELPNPWAPIAHGPVLTVEPAFSKKGILEDHLLWTLAPRFDVALQEGYQYYSPSNRFGVGRWFSGLFHLGLTHNLRYVDFFNVDPDFNSKRSLLGRDYRDPFVLSYLEARAQLFLTDSISKPSNGVILETLYDLAGGVLGGHFDYQKVVGGVRAYWKPVSRLQFAARARTGLIFPYGDSPGAPINMKFYLGGANTVRGWASRRLSPRLEECGEESCNYIPIGGYTMLEGNLELRLRTFGELYLVGFADAGDVQAGESKYVVEEWNYSAGPGVRYDSPLGMLRFDVGIRLNDPGVHPDEDAWGVHFGFGEAF